MHDTSTGIGDQIPFFRNLHHNHQRLDFYRNARLTTLEKGERLFHQGDKADSMYIILSGAVNILVKASASHTSLEDLKRLSTNARRWVASASEIAHNEYIVAGLGPTASFGEVGIDREDSRRTASVIAVEPCVLMRISAKAYQFCKADMVHDRMELVTGILRNVYYLSHWKSEAIESLARHCDMRSYDENKVIAKEGSELKDVAIVQSGELRVLKKGFDCKTNKPMFLEVQQLTQFDTFGHHALVRNIIRARLEHDAPVPVHHEWGSEDISYDHYFCVKRGVVKAKLLLIRLNDFIRIVLHDGITRQKMVSQYLSQEKNETEMQHDVLMEKKLSSEHNAIVTACSPKYTRRKLAETSNGIADMGSTFQRQWEKSKNFEKTIFSKVPTDPKTLAQISPTRTMKKKK